MMAGTMPNAARSTTAPARKSASTPAKLVLLCGSIVFTLAVLELGMRVAGLKPQTATVLSTYFQHDPQTGWRGKPNAESRFATTNFDVYITHDADGLRRGRYDAPIAADTASKHRVAWVLGDSGTWGWGVDDGKTYVDLLDESSTDGTRFRNLGHCGFSTLQEYLLLKDLFGRGHKPDEVVVLFCGNDLAENLDDRDQSPARPYLRVVGDRIDLMNYPTSPAAGYGATAWLKNHSLVWNHAHFYAMRLKQRLKEKPLPAETAVVATGTPTQRPPPPPKSIKSSERTSPPPSAPKLADSATPEQIAGLRYAYRLMLELCREHGVKLYVVDDGSYLVFSTCRELNIPWIDLAPAWERWYASGEPIRSWQFLSDPHYNELGHRLIAAAVRIGLAELREPTPVAVKAEPSQAR